METKINSSLSGKRTLLIVEDNEMNREMLEGILEEQYEILQAENGAIGLEILQEHMNDISVVILDVQMPVMDGYEFLQRVKQDPFLSQIPIVVATSVNENVAERRCLELGATDFVNKPYNGPIILSRIAGLIKLRESVATMTLLQTDEKTGLYTLQAFYYHAQRQIAAAPEKSYMVTVLNVDRFKLLNEVYGEETANQVLRNLAATLKDYMAAADANVRFGAARFFLLTETMSAETVAAWIKDIFTALGKAFMIRGGSFKAGIYKDIDKNLPVATICDRAVIALSSVERQYGDRYAYYDESYVAKERRLARLEADMRTAYENDQFQVYYQPKHDVQTGNLVGAEALLRWQHPELGFLSPGEFIPLFERNGFISYADYYALKRTCSNLRKWLDEGISCVPVSVNASRRDFETENYFSVVKTPMEKYNITASLIHIEVTESLFSDRLEEISQILQECRNAGIEIELDDFGTGYSSLTTLATLPLDVVKLDMSFMRNIGDEKKRKVLSASIELAKLLGLKVVSEGVETEEQLAILQKLGCDWIQGYYYSKPLPEKEFEEYLKRYSEKE